MEKYFTARLNFFKTHPGYQRIFCEAVITPPVHLKAEIQERKQMFDDLNDEILKELLSPVALRPAITREDALETFRQFQDFINARYQMAEVGTLEFTAREQNCRKALDILLYGVIDTSGLSHNT